MATLHDELGTLLSCNYLNKLENSAPMNTLARPVFLDHQEHMNTPRNERRARVDNNRDRKNNPDHTFSCQDFRKELLLLLSPLFYHRSLERNLTGKFC